MVTPTELGQANENNDIALANDRKKPVSATPDPSGLANRPKAVTISGELYAFLMGEAPMDGIWFGEMNENFRGAFWWRALLRCAAGWPDTAQSHDPD